MGMESFKIKKAPTRKRRTEKNKPIHFFIKISRNFTARSSRPWRGSLETQRSRRGNHFWRIGERPILQKSLFVCPEKSSRQTKIILSSAPSVSSARDALIFASFAS
jgi:hypothetical protein